MSKLIFHVVRYIFIIFCLHKRTSVLFSISLSPLLFNFPTPKHFGIWQTHIHILILLKTLLRWIICTTMSQKTNKTTAFMRYTEESQVLF